MARTTVDIYRSQNGDVWQLISDDASGQSVVRHQANQPSGGARTEVTAEEFLSQGGSGPEYAALRRILDQKERESSSSWDTLKEDLAKNGPNDPP